jgi:hypothetical protein
MPTKTLNSPVGRDGSQKLFKFGGGANTINAMDHSEDFGYWINAGGGNDAINGADYQLDANGDPIGFSDDTLIGGTGSDMIFGGLGDDHIFGGKEDGSDGGKGRNPTVTNSLYGEESFVFLSAGESFTGGDDVITAGNDVRNFLYGDIKSANGDATTTFTGGNDTLIGGTNSEDVLIGDWSSDGGSPTLNGGEDTFVIKQSGGKDTIWDFRSTDDDPDTARVGDKVDLSDYGFDNFGSLDNLWYDNFGSLALDFDGNGDGFGDVLIFANITFVSTNPDADGFGLVAGDFIFV